MVALRYLLSAFTGAALFPLSALAHSVKREPLDYVTQIEDVHIKTPSQRVHAHSSFDITFTLHGGREAVRLALEPNHDILHESFAITYMGNDGNFKSSETVERAQHKVFKGRAYVQHQGREGWWHAGWARISVHRDGKDPLFDGSFTLDGNSHIIQTGATYQRLRHEEDPVHDGSHDTMVVWRGSDVRSATPSHGELKRDVSSNATCDSDSLDFNVEYNRKLRQSSALRQIDSRSLFGRQLNDDMGSDGAGMNLLDSIGSTAGCPDTPRVALVGIATDCNYWAEFDNREDLTRSVIAMVNQASEVYERTFRIALGIQNLTILDDTCPGEAPESAPFNFDCDGGNINDRLNTFSEWRGRSDDTNAYWTLLTACSTAQAVGLAWRGQLCRRGSGPNGQDGGTIAGANVVVRASTEWQIFAHETGHTFGAVHDCTAGDCPYDEDAQECCPLTNQADRCDANEQFMMNPSTRQDITDFSACSIGNICGGMLNGIDGDCLTNNRNIETISGSQCGNGIVETGEDCDCGGAQGCGDNSCCNPETCEFRGDAVCDPVNEECCTDQCQFASASFVCRNSTSSCDPEETCSGDAGHCPSDNHLDDGESCGDDGDGLSCASGLCTSRAAQCRANSGGFSNVGTITGACDDDSRCQLTCTSSQYGSGQCVEFQQNFVDGTPCRAGGHCQDGRCEGASTANQIREWIVDNPNIVIPVAVVVGLLLLAAIGSCIWSCCRRRRRNVRKAPTPRAPETSNWPSYRAGPTGPMSNQNGQAVYSPVPSGHQPWGNRTQSMRYA